MCGINNIEPCLYMNARTLIQTVVVSYTLFQLVSLPLRRRTEAKAAASLSERRPRPPGLWNLNQFETYYFIVLFGC